MEMGGEGSSSLRIEKCMVVLNGNKMKKYYAISLKDTGIDA